LNRSTPLGGGVVAFPISVLVLGFTSEQSRDASVLVQSIGMTAASFLLFTTKPELLHARTICISVVFGSLGMLVGLATNMPSSIVNLIYTTLVFEFGILYYYTNTFVTTTWIPRSEYPCPDLALRKKHMLISTCLLISSAVLGGFMTANVGSGSDIFMYAYGIYGWNILNPDRRMDDNKYTASSVVVMATLSVLTSLTRALNGGFSSEVLQAWGAMSFVVVLGAPVGSLILTPAATPYLRILFYALALIQFVLFGVLKIKDDVAAWIAIAAITCIVLISLLVHYFRILRPRIPKFANTKNYDPSSITII